ncbi:MAG: GNAT family N-acetyltransferase [Candidatus Omnitrophota bacterium]
MDTASKFIVKVVDKIAKFPEKDWKSVFPKALENYHFFKSLDESSFDQFDFFYILVYESGLPVGATSCFITNFPLSIAVKGPLKRLLGLIERIAPQVFNPKTLICGLPMGEGRIGVIGDTGRVMNEISGALERLAKEQKARLIMYKDFNGSYENMLNPAIRDGYLRLESFPSTDMEVNFKDFDGYLKRLSRSSRENLKRNLKKADTKAKIVLTVKNILEPEELAQAYELYLQTYNKQEMGFEKLPMDFFSSVAKNMPDKTRFFLWRIEARMVAFAFCLVEGDYFIDYYLGFDYSVAYIYSLYFVRFRDLMQWCIGHGIKRYEMGATTYEPKKRLDFHFIRLYLYIKHRNKLINRLSGLISYFLKPENFDPVFKQLSS